MIDKTCATCGGSFKVPQWRGTAKYCSPACRIEAAKAPANATCAHCGKQFHVKVSQLRRYPRTLGVFCSNVCLAEKKKTAYSGHKNPNYRGRTADSDGYLLHAPAASNLHTGGRGKKLHIAVAEEVLGVRKIPAGLCVHHRDCDLNNNEPRNLVVLTRSDHKWLHKQYGVAVLWARHHGRVSIDELVSWSDDKPRAARLLPLNVTQQSAFELGIQTNEELTE